MKLQAQASKKGGKYPKFVIVLPKEVVEKVGFKKGDELKAEVKGEKIEIRK